MASIKVAWLRDGIVTDGEQMYCKCHFCVVHSTYSVMFNRFLSLHPCPNELSSPNLAIFVTVSHPTHTPSRAFHDRAYSIINVVPLCSTYHAFEHTFKLLNLNK